MVCPIIIGAYPPVKKHAKFPACLSACVGNERLINPIFYLSFKICIGPCPLFTKIPFFNCGWFTKGLATHFRSTIVKLKYLIYKKWYMHMLILYNY